MFGNTLWRGARVALLLACAALVISPLAFGDDQRAATPSDLAAKEQALSAGHLPAGAEEVVREGIMRASLQQQTPSADPGNETDFADLGRTDAARLFSSEQPDVVHGEGWADPDPSDQAASIALLSPSAASVTAEDGTTSVAVSSEPMGFPTAGGALQQIDLDLHDVQDGYQTDASPVTTVLPESTADPIQLGSGDTSLSVRPGGATVTGVRRDSGVFYANIANDVDFFAKPVFGGAETYHFLRSVQSPEDLTLDVVGPAPSESELISGTEHTAAVEIGNDRPWTISPVTASDANGVDVPVTVSYDGDRMTIHVAHRDAGYVYPITVDPTFNMDGVGNVIDGCWSEVQNYHNGCQVDAWEGSGSSDYNTMLSGPGATNGGWSYWTSAPGRMANFAGDAYLGRGLYIRTLIPGNYTAWADAAYWTLTAPPETRITKAFFANLSTDNWGDNASCSFVGIIENNNAWSSTGPLYVGNCAQQTLDALTWSCEVSSCNAGLGGTYRNWAVFGADIRRTGTTNGFAHDMGAAIVYMHDDVGPRLGELARADDNSPFVADIEDWGLGLKSWTVSSPGNPLWGQSWADNGCTGGVGRLVCPRAFTPSLSLCGLPPGNNTINMTAKDVSGNLPSNPHTGTVNVHAGLTNISGTLISAPGMTVTNNGQLTLHTQAQDPCGIQTMTAVIDGSQSLTPPRPSTTTADWTIDAPQLSVGQHTLVLNAQRNPFAGSSAWLDQRTYTFYVAPTSVTYGGPNRSIDTTAELQAFQDVLEADDDDADVDRLWNGLTSADRARYDNFVLSQPSPTSGVGDGQSDSIKDTATPIARDSALANPPSVARSRDMGSCRTANVHLGPPPPLGAPAPSSFPASFTHWEPLSTFSRNGRSAARVQFDMKISTPWRVRGGLNATIEAYTEEDAGTQKWSGLKSAASRERSRGTNKYYYAHLAMNAYVGNHIFWRGDTSFVPLEWVVGNVALFYAGDYMPGMPFWYRCEV